MKKYDSSKPVIFMHIPKCAGSSFIRLLREWFGNQYCKLNQDERQDVLLPRIKTRDEDGKWDPNIKVVHGHFDNGRGYGLPYYYPEIDQYFTIFRDPFDVVVSMFFFCKGRSAEGKYWYRGKQVNILEQYPTVEYYLRETPYWLYNHLPQDLTLQNFEEKLRQRFIYIGIQEDLPRSIGNLAKILGKPEVVLPRINESVYDEPFPEWLREKFYQDYPLLCRVYQFAKANYRSTDAMLNSDRQPVTSPSLETGAEIQPDLTSSTHGNESISTPAAAGKVASNGGRLAVDGHAENAK